MNEAYTLAYTLSRDSAPGASHAELSVAAHDRLGWPAYAPCSPAELVAKLRGELTGRRNGHIAEAARALHKANIAKPGLGPTMEEERRQAIAQVERQRPWLFEKIRAPEVAPRARSAPPAPARRAAPPRATVPPEERAAIVTLAREWWVDQHLKQAGLPWHDETARAKAGEIAEILDETTLLRRFAAYLRSPRIVALRERTRKNAQLRSDVATTDKPRRR